MKQQARIVITKIAVAGSILLDRITKQYALMYLAPWAPEYSVTPWLSLELTYNRGISWGMMQSENPWSFWLVTGLIIVITGVVIAHARVRIQEGKWVLGHALIVGGSISNCIDRFYYHGVIDFIHLQYGDWSWPIFNIADVAIVIGAGVLFWESFQE